MWTHEVKLEKYEATTPGGGPLQLGTAESQGNEFLHIKAGEGWEGLAIKVVFRPCKVSRMVPEDGLVSVPWEATKDPLTASKGRIVFRGLDESGRVMNSLDLPYEVKGHSPTGDRDENKYTPSAVDQIIAETKADAAAADLSAKAAAESQKAAAASAAAALQSAKAAADTLEQLNTKANAALTDIDDAKTKALTALTNEGTAQKKAVTDVGKKALDDLETARRAAETGLTETGNAQKQAVQDAGTTALKQVNTAGQTQTDRVNKAGEDKLAQIDAVNAHPPIVQGGTWWTWDTASGAYTDTGLTAEGKDGNVLFATFAVDPATGLLSMTTPGGYAGPEFTLNNGYLEVTVNA